MAEVVAASLVQAAQAVVLGRSAKVRLNPSFKPSPNGKPPGPGRGYAVQFPSPSPGVLPLVLA